MKLSALSEPHVKEGFAIGDGAGNEWALFGVLLVRAAEESAVEAAARVCEL